MNARAGGCASRWAYRSCRCGLCDHDHTFDTCTGLNNHSSKQHGYYYTLKGDCFVPLRENSVCARVPPPATAHYYGGAQGGGQRSRGRVRHAPRRIWPPYPHGVPPMHYPRDADRQFVTPQAVRSSIVTTWLQPQFLAFDEDEGLGLPATPLPPATPDQSPTPLCGRCHPLDGLG